MTDTRARQAAAGPDVLWRLRRLGELNGGWPLPIEAAAAIEARDAEIARLQGLVTRAQLCVAEFYHRWHEDARAALAPPPASDGGEA